ncbi:MAG: arginyltransferase [Acidobacteriota bacterium]
MLQIIRETTHDEQQCAYLPDRGARMRYRLIDACPEDDYQQMLERGWRRFGRVFFRPACEGCWECRSLRVDVAAFEPNRSMRRTVRRNQDLEIVLRSPSITRQHLELYQRYHRDMAARRAWPDKDSTPVDYFQTFVEGSERFGRELLFLEGERLVAVALVDVLPQAVSAVYCFYDPEMRRRSLGVFSVLQQVALAESRGVPYLYLGYWVAGNASMRYKANYHPHQILAGRPKASEAPSWRQPAADAVHSEVSS